ncbi:MAG: NAD(P)/FAD-dependent oxidoreductase [Xenophilus sp.]
MNTANTPGAAAVAAGGDAFTHDLVIVGAGPAGMSAAMTAMEHGLRTVVLDEQPRAGGQIYRNVSVAPPTVAALLGSDYRHGGKLVQRFLASGVETHHDTLVWDIGRDLTVTAQKAGRSFIVRAPQLLVANGAMERPSPILGWTLPGVMNAGAAQIALKTAGQVPTGAVVLVGNGPLLLLVACQLLKAGARVAAIVDTSPASNRARARPHALSALRAPGMLAKGLRMLWQLRQAGVPYFKHAESVHFEASDDQQRVETVSFTSQGSRHRLRADVVLLHHGLVPNTQIARLLQVNHVWSDTQLAWQPVVDHWGQASLAGLRLAGDGCSIGGALAAQARGAIAALGAAVALGKLGAAQAESRARALRRRLDAQTAIRPFLDALYRPPEWLIDCPDETLVCRCEEVTAGRIREMARLGCQGPNQTKFFSRCGMGPCQGRMCGTTVTQVLAQALDRAPGDVGAYRIRAPLKPVRLDSLAALAEPTSTYPSTSTRVARDDLPLHLRRAAQP